MSDVPQQSNHRFSGEIEMLDGGDVLRLDQIDCETVRLWSVRPPPLSACVRL
jgi:hypothetical protein